MSVQLVHWLFIVNKHKWSNFLQMTQGKTLLDSLSKDLWHILQTHSSTRRALPTESSRGQSLCEIEPQMCIKTQRTLHGLRFQKNQQNMVTKLSREKRVSSSNSSWENYGFGRWKKQFLNSVIFNQIYEKWGTLSGQQPGTNVYDWINMK